MLNVSGPRSRARRHHRGVSRRSAEPRLERAAGHQPSEGLHFHAGKRVSDRQAQTRNQFLCHDHAAGAGALERFHAFNCYPRFTPYVAKSERTIYLRQNLTQKRNIFLCLIRTKFRPEGVNDVMMLTIIYLL